MHSSSEAWLQRFSQRPQSVTRLFCFAHAGGGAASFRLWDRQLPASIDVAAIQLPGRANRWGEPLMTDLPAMVQALLPALLPQLDRPYAFFGHSMGATLAHAVTHELVARGAPLPGHLFLSARRPPRLPDARPPLHPLSDAEFVAEVNRRYGGIPAEVLAEKDLLALLLPCLRADIHALETYRPEPSTPLDIPVTACGGESDALAPAAHLEAWRDETRGPFRVRLFPGGHFYLEACRDAVLAEVAATLAVLPDARPAQEARA